MAGKDPNDDDDIIPGRYYGEYVCSKGTKDEHKFISWKPNEEKRECRRHPGRYAIRLVYRELRKSDIPKDYRLFGRFTCECGNNWGSASAWKGYYQECKSDECIKKTCTCTDGECKNEKEHKNEVYTWDFYKLHRNGGQNLRNGHMTKYCEKCKELGKSCLGAS